MSENITMQNLTEVTNMLKRFEELWNKVADSEHSGQAYSYELSSIAKTLMDMNLSEEFKNLYLSEEERFLLADKVTVIAHLD